MRCCYGREVRARDVEALREPGLAHKPGPSTGPKRAEAQRTLLLGAMTRAVGEHGYEACRVEDVLALSSLSRATFYKFFADKRECFMAAFEAAVDALLAATVEAAEATPDPEARVKDGIDALIGHLTADPAMAQMALVEIRTAGTEGQERYEAASKRFASLLSSGGCLRRGQPGMEMKKAEWAVDSVVTVLWMEISGGRTERLPRLVPALVAVVRR